MTEDLSLQLVHFAKGHLGFTQVGILPVTPAATFPYFSEWLDHHYQADMAWLETDGRKEKRAAVQAILPQAKTVITLAYTYRTTDLPPEVLNDPSRGIFARYTWGRDYHHVIKKKLLQLIKQVEQVTGREVVARAYVDTGPILERELAERAGIGFTGNNSMLISPLFGSYLFLCEIILDQSLWPVTHKARGGCRTCTKCVTSCPTKAIVANKVIDARKCISYLTIESKGTIPEALRPLLHNRIYGCDICQEVCPWNDTAQAKQMQSDWLESALHRQAPPLVELAQLTEATFLERYQGTPIMRAKRSGLLRNVGVALGNWGSAEAGVALEQLAQDSNELIREHALWGLRQIDKMSTL
ncbi:MAG: tRNA epoxyqueuosine(34) reductase QueG [Candidatus Kerfeldbacteria bacterium]|nr:tRNA epoxyqueuosine(34) reductase QueG [Candidatus Kerfeldbacteria bacterium]